MRLDIREGTPALLSALMKACWLREPPARPSFTQIAAAIKEHLPQMTTEELVGPPSPLDRPLSPLLQVPSPTQQGTTDTPVEEKVEVEARNELKELIAAQVVRGRDLPPSMWGGYARSCIHRWRQMIPDPAAPRSPSPNQQQALKKSN